MINPLGPSLPLAVPGQAELKLLADLLKIVADPHAAKVHVEQLTKAADELRTRKAEHDRAQAELTGQMQSHNEALTRSSKEHADKLAAAQAEHDAEHQRRSVALTARTAAADAREQKLQQAEQMAAALRADLDRRLSLLQQATVAA
jgi:hypothetical protein